MRRQGHDLPEKFTSIKRRRFYSPQIASAPNGDDAGNANARQCAAQHSSCARVQRNNQQCSSGASKYPT